MLLVRDRQGRLHVFLNTCRHRGMKVCRYDEGNTLLFTCPFHGWSYDTDGRLVGVPEFQSAYHGELDKARWGLPEARITNYHGSIWANWDPNAPSMSTWATYAPFMERDFEGDQGRPHGLELSGGVHKWRMPRHWKFSATRRNGHGAHGTLTHRSIKGAAIGLQGDPEGGGRHGVRSEWPRMHFEVSIPGLGRGCHPSMAEPGAPNGEA